MWSVIIIEKFGNAVFTIFFFVRRNTRRRFMFCKLLLHGIQFSSGVSPTFAVIIIRCKPPSVPTVLRPPAEDDLIRGENKTSPVDSVWGPRGIGEGDGVVDEAGIGRTRRRKEETIVVSCPGSDS